MPSISTRKALQACIVCVWSSLASASAFTNHAGHAVSGRLTALTNGVAVIGGRGYPLSIFPDSEQARMRELLRVPLALPPALESRRIALRERLLRSEALLKAGAKTPEAAAAQRERLETAWRRALESAKLDEATRAYWLEKLAAPDAGDGDVPAGKGRGAREVSDRRREAADSAGVGL